MTIGAAARRWITLGLNLVQKILGEHLVAGELKPGAEIAIRIDQTLTQDATGTMAYLQFEAMGIPRVRTECSVSYVDHNTLQTGFENADDHLFLQDAAARFGVWFSRPGNGICHQVHLERFAVPGRTLLGSDSHTPTCGGLGMIAMGAGGLDVACAMAGEPYALTMPAVVRVHLTGELGPWVSAKDVILELLRRETVRGGVGRIYEYDGPGVATLSVPERATITNMGAELGATTSVFPSDDRTREFLAFQKRAEAYRAIEADHDAMYDDRIDIDLSALEPLVACPHSPDAVQSIRELEGTRVVQALVGSCTNSSYRDMATVALMLRGRKVHPNLSAGVSPGSRQVFEMMARDGYLADLISAGVRILESACGPCIGMGQAPPSGGVSVRSFNRNFPGRSGTRDAQVYLASPEVCAAAMVCGELVHPERLGERPSVAVPASAIVDDGLIIPPPADGTSVAIRRGPNIKPLPAFEPIPDCLTLRVALKVADNITTDHISPAGSRFLPLRSNIPAISEYVFSPVDPEFASRCKEWGGGLILGGSNYGQGSSREHAALGPRYLGIRVVVAKSFARIHWSNLVNFGILPLVVEASTYDALEQGDEVEVCGVHSAVRSGGSVTLRLARTGAEFEARHHLTPAQAQILLAGGRLNAARGASGA